MSSFFCFLIAFKSDTAIHCHMASGFYIINSGIARQGGREKDTKWAEEEGREILYIPVSQTATSVSQCLPKYPGAHEHV